MAKVISPYKIRGSIGNQTFFENEFGLQVKEKGGPTKWQVQHLDQFDNTRRNAAEWQRATAGSKLLRAAIGSLKWSINNNRLNGRMNSKVLAALKADPIHDKGERVISSGDLSLISGFEFNHQLSLNEALPLNIKHCYSIEAGKAVVNIPAFRLRKKKGLPAAATLYQIVSAVVTVDFDRRRFTLDKQEGELQATGRTAGAAFCVEHTVQPANEQGCFWLMGIEFYQMVNDHPVLVKGGALRVMEWIGNASHTECVSVVPERVVEDLSEESLFIDGPVKVSEKVSAAAELTVEVADTAALLMEAFWEAVDAGITVTATPSVVSRTGELPIAETPGNLRTQEVDLPVSIEASELIDDGTAEIFTIPIAEFERSLRVLLPVNGGERRDMRPELFFNYPTETSSNRSDDSQST